MMKITEEYALIGGDIHKLVKIKDDQNWTEYAWRIHYKDDLYFVPVKDNSLHGYTPPRLPYKRRRVFNNSECA